MHVGPVKTFDNFIVPLPAGIGPARYDTVIVWWPNLPDQFITSARYPGPGPPPRRVSAGIPPASPQKGARRAVC